VRHALIVQNTYPRDSPFLEFLSFVVWDLIVGEFWCVCAHMTNVCSKLNCWS
jgi:hypothetical protein